MICLFVNVSISFMLNYMKKTYGNEVIREIDIKDYNKYKEYYNK